MVGRDSATSPGKTTRVAQLTVQRRARAPGLGPTTEDMQATAAQGVAGAAGPLPHLDVIQHAFGRHDVSNVRAHTDHAAREASAAIGAEAYATGNAVAFAATPSLHTAAHEAAHVIQQRGGVQLKGGVGEAGDTHEQQADRIADAVVAGQSAEPLLAQIAGDGGGAPTSGVQRKAADFKPGASIEKMTLTQFDAYARTQADWATGPKVGGDKDKLWELLEKARSDEAFLAGCGPMRVSGLLTAMADPAKLAALEHYCAAVHKDRPTVEVEPIASSADAIKMGDALPLLEATPGGVTMKTIMKQESGNTQLQDMIAAKAVDPFIKYVQTSHPVLQANSGAEISSYLAMKAEGVDPSAYKAKLPRIRSLHRFEKAALDAFAINEGDTSKTKPLTLVLHSALDWNGAFHRDPNITKVAKHPKNVTIMIEGKESLAEVQADIDPLAKKYGKDDKIDQVMFAGHGSARSIELAGKVKDGKSGGKDAVVAQGDDVDLDNNKAKTDALFDELMKHMDPASPHHRVVFNACLTNSNAVTGPLDPDPVKAQAQIKAAIAKDASLATTFKDKAKAMGKDIDSRGADGSIGQVGLINKGSGALDIVSKADPHVTDAKIKYVEFGTEPEGVMRAVVEEWGNDKTACLDAIARRQKPAAPKDWDGRYIHAMLDVVKANPDNADLMNQFANGASSISEAKLEDECRVDAVAGGIPAGSRAGILGELAKTDDWKAYKYIPLVFYQVWSKIDASKATAFRDHLGARFTCHSAARFVDVDFLVGAGVLDGLLPVPPPASPPAGQLILALIDVAQRRKGASARAIAYLQGVLGSERWFPAGLRVAARLDGLATENEILVAIDRAKPSAKTPDPNIDTDRDGKNDSYVEPLTKTGKVDVPSTDVWQKPDDTSTKLGNLPQGTAVRVVGKASPDWLAIEYNNRTAFAKVTDIAV